MTRQQQRIGEAFRVQSYYHGMNGLGITSQTITQTVGASLMATAGIVAATGVGALPAAVIAAVGALTSLVGSLFKPDLTKIQASNIVNQIEAQALKPMRASWQALPASQKTEAMRAHYLNIFDQAWNAVLQGCSNAALGTAGQACISDRQQGACHYTVDGQTPGVPPNCGNWFVWYRDPIANDPNVIPDSLGGSVSGVVDSLSSASGLSPLWIGAGLIGLALLAVGD